jgi:hypothetical protein
VLGTFSKPGGTVKYSANTRSLIVTLVALGCCIGAIFTPFGTAQAAAPGYKVSMIKSAAEDAREAVENGEAPQQDCTMVSMQGKSIIKDHSDDAEAVSVATEAMEACSFEIPVAYFGMVLDTVQKQLEADPDDVNPCNDFTSEFTVYFSIAASPPPGAADSEERVKAALSERAKEVCPFSASMMGF